MKDWLVPIIAALLSSGAFTGLAALVQAIVRRGKTRVDAVDVLSDTAREWVVDFKAEATAARAETAAARAETETLRSEVRRLSREATAVADDLHRLRLAIMAPAATIDGLRDLVRRGSGPSTNGRT